MSKGQMFVRGVLLAAACALAWPPWALCVAPLIGYPAARALYLATVTVLWTVATAPPRTRRLPLAVVTTAVALAVATLARGAGELALGLAAVVGFARLTLQRGALPARALAGELLLLGGGLLFARFLSAPSLLSLSLALWGFLLVQSLSFLTGSPGVRTATTPRNDPFDDAYRRAMAIIEG